MADLFTLSDLAAYLQKDLDTASATIAQQKAQALVRRYCRQNINSQTYTAVGLQIREATGIASRDMRLTASRIPRLWSDPLCMRLPQRPVTAIASVVINSITLTQDVDWAWDGASPQVLLSRVPWKSSSFQAWPVAFVTYTAGYTTVPDDVAAVALAVAGRMYDNPRGIRTRAIDDASETRAGADDDLAGVTLLKAEMRMLKPFRVGTRTVGPGA